MTGSRTHWTTVDFKSFIMWSLFWAELRIYRLFKWNYFVRKRRKILQNFFTGCCVIFTGDMPSGAEFHGLPLFAPMVSKGMGSSSNHDSRICQFTVFYHLYIFKAPSGLKFLPNVEIWCNSKYDEILNPLFQKIQKYAQNNAKTVFSTIHWV